MKIAYIPNSDNPFSKHSWSGTDYYVRKCLEDQGHDVYCIYGLKIHMTMYSLFWIIMARLVGKKYIFNRNKKASQMWSKFIQARLQKNTEVIFSLGTIQIACLETDIPIYVYVDGIFEQMRTFYEWGNLSQKCISDANQIEQRALDKCKKIISCSKETGDYILQYYHVPREKLSIIPLGANLDSVPNRAEIFSAISDRDKIICNLLFVGVEWKRKGADIVLKTTKILHKRGIHVVLHLCGLKEIPEELPDYVINHGFLDKSKKEDYAMLESLYKSSHFLFVPSQAEAYGLVFCEASAYGLPSLSHSLGGLTTIVENGQNGQLFEKGTKAEVFADYIEKIFEDRDAYLDLAKKARLRYENKLNWEVAGESITSLINEGL